MMATLISSRTPSPPPNIVWVMADDLDNDWKDDRLSYMRNLRTRLRDVTAVDSNPRLPLTFPCHCTMHSKIR